MNEKKKECYEDICVKNFIKHVSNRLKVEGRFKKK